MKLPSPTYIPTWPIAVFASLLNITKSPGCKSLFSTATPFFIWSFEVLYSDIPKFLYTYDVNPEQSNPLDGDAPPDTYLYPKYCFAYSTTATPVVPDVDCSGSLDSADVSSTFGVSSCFVVSSSATIVSSFNVLPLLDVASGTLVSEMYFADTYPISPSKSILYHFPV